MNDQSVTMNQPQILNRDYGVWPPVPVPPPPEDLMKFHNPPRPIFAPPNPSRANWKPKMGFNNKRKDSRWTDKGTAIGAGAGGYKPPALQELQSQNRVKARRFYPKKKFNNRFAPYAPRNTTSFIIRAKKSGGIASLVSPCPVTPAVLSTPIFSPSREVLGDMAKEQWGVDGYGSMNGLIRLRSPGHEAEEEEEDGGSSESDVEERVEVERRLNHDLSRFEMIYPNWAAEHYNLSENHVDDEDQESHIARLEEENLTLKERLFLMERELMDLRTRLQCLETESSGVKKESSKDKNDDQILDTHEEGLENEQGCEIKGETFEVQEDGIREENNNVEALASGNVCSEKSSGEQLLE